MEAEVLDKAFLEAKILDPKLKKTVLKKEDFIWLKRTRKISILYWT